MIHGGLCSVTFRALEPREVARLAKQAGLECIEWGGDVHVPHSDAARAREVRAITVDAGLRVASYGSYYRVVPVDDPVPFELIVETAAALGAPLIRVWAGKLGSEAADDAHRWRVAEEACRIAETAAVAGIAVALEYHDGTLTDRAQSAADLLRCAGQPNLGTYWQPRPELCLEENLAALTTIRPWLSSLHVFHWLPDPGKPTAHQRRPLEEGAADWLCYLHAAGGGDSPAGRDALLEFVASDAEDAFLADARTLLRLLEFANQPAREEPGPEYTHRSHSSDHSFAN